MTVIQVDGVTKRYGDDTAIRDLDLTIQRGEVFGFLGPNGAGKTTTIDILLDFVRPTSGSATVLGEDPKNTREIHPRIGVLPEGYDLYDRLTGRKHLEFAAETKGTSTDLDELLERVELRKADAERNVGEYSKGMKQRLAMAIALVGDPELLILDEPSAGLDPTGIERMQDIVREETTDGTTVFFSSHILGQVEAVCDRVGVLDDGELVAVDSIQGLRERIGGSSNVLLSVDRVPETALRELTDIEGVSGYTAEDDEVTIRCSISEAKVRAITHVANTGTTIQDIQIEDAGLTDLFGTLVEEDHIEEVDE